MPDYFSHAICAQKILEKCDRKLKTAINNHTLYMLGAQGGDVYFAYKISLSENNIGRRLHNTPADALFSVLAKKDLSYAAGFATHYALDCTLHPAIYAFEASSKAPFSHLRFENDLGLYISRKYAIPRKILPRERILQQTFVLYDCIKEIAPDITVTGVERCLKRHFTYTRTIYKRKKQEYTFDYDYSSLSGAVDDAVALGAECVKAVLEGSVNGELFSRSFLEK